MPPAHFMYAHNGMEMEQAGPKVSLLHGTPENARAMYGAAEKYGTFEW